MRAAARGRATTPWRRTSPSSPPSPCGAGASSPRRCWPSARRRALPDTCQRLAYADALCCSMSVRRRWVGGGGDGDHKRRDGAQGSERHASRTLAVRDRRASASTSGARARRASGMHVTGARVALERRARGARAARDLSDTLEAACEPMGGAWSEWHKRSDHAEAHVLQSLHLYLQLYSLQCPNTYLSLFASCL